MRQAGHAKCTGAKRNAYRVLVRKLDETAWKTQAKMGG
jgi:hypothetical protein